MNRDSAGWFGWYVTDEPGINGPVIELADEILSSRRKYFVPGVPEDYIEFRLLANQTSLVLSAYNRFLFHSVAFL